jgi:hypothetical protein
MPNISSVQDYDHGPAAPISMVVPTGHGVGG